MNPLEEDIEEKATKVFSTAESLLNDMDCLNRFIGMFLWQLAEKARQDLKNIDPSTGDGSRIVYEREISPEVRSSISPDTVGDLRNLRIRILLKGSDSSPESVRFELTDLDDVFFYYKHSVDSQSYREIQAQQRLYDFMRAISYLYSPW